MTPEEIRVRLGLRPWEDHARQVREFFAGQPRMLPEVGRRSGRTTRLMVDTLSAMSEGRTSVVVLFNNDSRHIFRELLRENLTRLGVHLVRSRLNSLEPTLPWAPVFFFTARQRSRGVTCQWLGIDHVVDEAAPEEAQRWRGEFRSWVAPTLPPIIRRTGYEILLDESPWD